MRVWFGADGAIYVRTPGGRIWKTINGEQWTAGSGVAPSEAPVSTAGPEFGSRTASHPLLRSRLFAAGAHVWKSEDSGGHWQNLTAFGNRSILGGAAYDLALSPSNPDDIVVAGERGVWRSLDAGNSWFGLNDQLPNLPVTRLLTENADEGSIQAATASGVQLKWQQGERSGWVFGPASALAVDAALRTRATVTAGTEISAIARVDDLWYAGAADGRLFSSRDDGATWQEMQAGAPAGPILRIFVDARDSNYAVALTGGNGRGRVLRTFNGGAFWDDITANLPAGNVSGVAADRLTNAIYIAGDAGLFMTYADTRAPSESTVWTQLRSEASRDVALDRAGNQLYVALDELGVYATLAPHRLRDPRVVSAGDRILRAIAPGSLLSVIGARVQTASVGERPASVLAAGDTESQVHVPYDLPGGQGVLISMNSTAGRIQLGLPLAPASPSIFIDPEGNPLIVHADSGLMLDAGAPARSGARVQIFATGLGRVAPQWPVGIAAPLKDPPRVLASVRATLDRESLEVTRATLAPGYVGLYVVEVQLPAIVNRGPAELLLEAEGQISNAVRLWLEP